MRYVIQRSNLRRRASFTVVYQVTQGTTVNPIVVASRKRTRVILGRLYRRSVFATQVLLGVVALLELPVWVDRGVNGSFVTIRDILCREIAVILINQEPSLALICLGAYSWLPKVAQQLTVLAPTCIKLSVYCVSSCLFSRFLR